jgi:hypothetical protein
VAKTRVFAPVTVTAKGVLLFAALAPNKTLCALARRWTTVVGALCGFSVVNGTEADSDRIFTGFDVGIKTKGLHHALYLSDDVVANE